MVQNKANIMELQDILHFFKIAGNDTAVTDTPVNALASNSKIRKQLAPNQQALSPPYAETDQNANKQTNIDLQTVTQNHIIGEQREEGLATNQAYQSLLQSQQSELTTQKPVLNTAKTAVETNQATQSNGVYQGGASASARPRPPLEHKSHKEWLAYAVHDAQQAIDLVDLKQRITAFDGCNLKFTAKNTCIADGSEPRDLMFIGEGPGAEEDRQALPFVGRGGQLLNLMLSAIGYGRESQYTQTSGSDQPPQLSDNNTEKLAYITNAVFWRPPGNRTPTLPEIELCRPYLQRQIELVKPRVIVSLGGVAATALLGEKHPILKLRGHWQSYKLPDGTEIAYMPSLHPAFLLRSPLQKKSAWHDFLAAKIQLRSLE